MKLTPEQISAIKSQQGTVDTSGGDDLDARLASLDAKHNAPKEGFFAKLAKVANKDYMGMAGDVAKGFGKEVLRRGYNVGSAMESGMEKLGVPKMSTAIAGRDIGGQVENIKEGTPSWLTSQNTAQKVGAFGEQAAEFLTPGNVAGKVGMAVKGAKMLAKAPKVAKLAGFGARSLTEGAMFGGQTLAQTGDPGEALTAAVMGLAMPTAGKVLGAVGKGAKKATMATLGKTTGGGKAALDEAFKNPNVIKFAREAGAEGAEDLQRRAVEESHKALNIIKKNRGEAYVKDLEKIKANPMQMDEAAIQMRENATNLMEPYGIKLDSEAQKVGKNVFDFGESTIIEHQPVVEKTLSDVFKWKDWSPAGMDTLKKRLYDFRNQAKYGTPAYSMVNKIAQGLDSSLKEMVPGYEKMTKAYREASDLIDDAEKALSLGNKASLDTTVRKLTSIMRDNNEVRKEIVDVLTKTGGQDITGMMAGAALAPMAPRGIVAGTGLGIGVGAGLLNPASWPLAIAYLGASSPRLVGEFVSLMGKASRGANGLIRLTPGLKQNVERIFNDAEKGFSPGATKLAPEIKGAIEGFGEKGQKAVNDFVKKPKIGLGIEDVSTAEDAILSLVNRRKSMTRGDLQGAVEAQVRKVLGKDADIILANKIESNLLDIIDGAKNMTTGDLQAAIQAQFMPSNINLTREILPGATQMPKAQMDSIMGRINRNKNYSVEDVTPKGFGPDDRFSFPAVGKTADEKLTPFDTPEIIKARDAAKIQNSTHLIATPERTKLRNSVLNKLSAPSQKIAQGKIANIVIGPPAAGKSSVFADPLSKRWKARIIDADMAKELLPEFNKGRGAGIVHEESSMIAEKVLKRSARKGENIILPIVGKDQAKLMRIATKLKKKGYTVNLYLNHVPPETAAQRAVERFTTTGRFVDPAYVLNEVGEKPLENFNQVKSHPIFNYYEHRSNNVARGESPKLIERSRRRAMGR